MTHGSHEHSTPQKPNDDAPKVAAPKRRDDDTPKASPDKDSNIFDSLDHVHLVQNTDWTIAPTDCDTNDGGVTTYALAGALLNVKSLPLLASSNAKPLALLAYIFDGEVPNGEIPFVAAIISYTADATSWTLQTTASIDLSKLRVIGIPSLQDWRNFVSFPQATPQWNAARFDGGGDHPGDGNGDDQ